MTKRNSPAPLDLERWTQVQGRSPGPASFVYAVKTTGIFCRPGCASRLPLPANVAFYDSPAAAKLAGFRACLRCRPDAPGPSKEAWIETACRLLEGEESLSLAELGQRLGKSPFHLQRAFKKAVGVSPFAYRRQRMQESLVAGRLAGRPMTEAAMRAGYPSPSRASGDRRLLKLPRAHGVESPTVTFATAPCELGTVLVAVSGLGICAILLGASPQEVGADLRGRFPGARHRHDPVLEQALREVVELVDRGTALTLPLDIRGTAFQRRVWEALRQIPAGQTRSYGEVATAIAMPTASRAVARACAQNALALAIPCHRVVRGDGALSGYRWGVERKRALLDREGVSPGQGAGAPVGLAGTRPRASK